MPDTAQVFPILVITNVIYASWLFIGMLGFAPYIASLIIYGLALNSIRDEAQFVPFVAGAFVLDIIGHIITRLAYEVFVILPFILLIILYGITYYMCKNEVLLFGRTVQSLNKTDRELARTAMETKNVDDIAKVAKYTEWSSL